MNSAADARSRAPSPEGTPARSSSSGFLGSDLDAWVIASVVLVSSLVFLFWGGPLWRAPRGASHLSRIVVSYALAVPLVALVLTVGRRFAWSRLLSGVAIVWSAKLVITASLYAYIAPGSANEYTPTQSWGSKSSESSLPGASNASASAATGILSGTVRITGQPVKRAAIVVEGITGIAGAQSEDGLEVTIDHLAYGQPLYVTTPGEKIQVANHDAVLHTFRLTREGRAAFNAPIPASAKAPSLFAPEAGRYELSCENHASEHASLIVVDHPYVALTDAAGRFELSAVPEGARTIVVLRHGAASISRDVRVVSGSRVDVSIDLEGEGK